ncbi:hypothetical protein RRF57_010250 [Xylaria bambusicola]|uniref:Uncharacterized protein n=1 Tax=Xylaria bambusicola TaxID=326684 RepID=A0AAN7Z9F2_9PEZI
MTMLTQRQQQQHSCPAIHPATSPAPSRETNELRQSLLELVDGDLVAFNVIIPFVVAFAAAFGI